MKRREFIAGLAGATGWPLAAWAQPRERLRRVGVLMPYLNDDDPEGQAEFAALRQGLSEHGWIEGQDD
jgi:putative tryptophan/tyrosine transport system substrate-binding protein